MKIYFIYIYLKFQNYIIWDVDNSHYQQLIYNMNYLKSKIILKIIILRYNYKFIGQKYILLVENSIVSTIFQWDHLLIIIL
jgi:hypothetical protein